MRGIEYSPPAAAEIESIARVSPRQDGSKRTSTAASVPVMVTDEATVTDLSTLNSGLSICRNTSKKQTSLCYTSIVCG